MPAEENLNHLRIGEKKPDATEYRTQASSLSPDIPTTAPTVLAVNFPYSSCI